MKLITMKHLKIFFPLFILLFSFNHAYAQYEINKIESVNWDNNSLTIHTTGRITYTEARLKDPDRLVIDLLNTTLREKSPEQTFKSPLSEAVTVSQEGSNQVRIIFVGLSSINRKAYLTDGEKTLIIRIARISEEITEDEEEKITESEEKTLLEKHKPGQFKDVIINENDNETNIEISSTKSIKYSTYTLKNPQRLVLDLLNVLPPEETLPQLNPTPHVTGIRIGHAASGIEATRVVIDLVNENTDVNVGTNLLGNKLTVNLKTNKEKEEETKKSQAKVVIDPGHGGYDIGASYSGFQEKDINLSLGVKLKKLLEESGITAFLTRDDDSFLSLAERNEITNIIKPDVFVSIHANALKTSRNIRGLETYYWSGKSQKLAYFIHRSVLTKVKIPDHFIRTARFYVIRYTPVPAVLCELGFLSNPQDRELLTSQTTQDKYASALQEGILKFLDIETKKENKNE